MSSAGNQQHVFPAMPPSLSAGDYELRDYYTAPGAPRPAAHQSPYLTPYLGLRARLSQIWINRWTVLLLLILVRTLIAVATLDDSLGSARREALSACTSVETMGSAMASMPHYMSQGVNEITATGIESAVRGFYSMLTLSVTAVEEIIVFIINILTQTYVCLLHLAVTGSLDAAIKLVDSAQEFLDQTLGGISDDLASGVSSFQDGLNSFIDGLNGLPFGIGDSIPSLNLTDEVNAIKDVQLPDNLTSSLVDLNNSIPTFEQVNNATNNVIRLPFEEIKKLINQSITTYSFDRSLFPVPAKEQLNFCSDNQGVNDFFDNLVHIEVTARKIFIGVIIVLAILVCIPMAWWEIKRYRSMEKRAQQISKSADSMDAVYLASRPITSSIGWKLASRSSSIRRQNIIRWTVAYSTSTPALFILSLGFAGLFACLCQYILLTKIQEEVPALSNQVSAFAEKVVLSLNNASEQWALGTNAAINKTNKDINDDLFGWVETSTTAVNKTLNTFVDGTMDVLDSTFGGTVLEEPIADVLQCLIFLKIQGIQKALTWVHDNAHVNFPTLANDTFSLGAAASLTDGTSDDSFLADPGSITSDKITDVVATLTTKIAAGIQQEAIISACLIIVWGIIAFVGLSRALILYLGRGKTRAEGGQAYVVDPITDNMRVQDYPDVSAPPYEYHEPPVNKAAPYTLQPRPFPTFEPSSSSSQQTSHSTEDEKLGKVDAHNVGIAVTRPTHLRSSSHGDLGGTTPVLNEKSNNPFADPGP